jgi:hypothetical protein
MMAALLGFIKRGPAKEYLEGYHNDGEGFMYDGLYSVLRKAGCFKMVDAVCCGKIEQQTLHYDKSKSCPKMIPLKCTHITRVGGVPCQLCGIKRRLEILEVMETEFGEEEVEVMMWMNARRQGQKNGAFNTQRELQSQFMTVTDLLPKFRELLTICIPHCQEIRWIRQMIQLDFDQLQPNTLLIFTDFAAVMALRAFQTKNSSVDGHAVNDNFVCISNRRKCTIEEEKKINGKSVMIADDFHLYDVDVHHFFEETFSPGKKTDHAMHNVCLDKIIELYRSEFRTRNNRELEKVRIWTDNAPTQYRCRQNFVKAASVVQRHKGIQLTHRLAVVDNFKGFHDAVGKDPAQCVKSLELVGIRSPNAEAVFKNCYERLEKTRDQTEWRKYESARDPRVRRKGRFGMDTRTVWFVVETVLEQERLEQLYPGRILLCDRTFVLDKMSEKAIEGTNQMHELRSVATEVPLTHPITWPGKVANLPCNCIPCFEDPNNEICKFIPWRCPRDVKIQIKCIYPEEAETWVGSELAHNVDKKPKLAKAIEFLPSSSKWKIKFGNDETILISYDQFCRGKKRLHKMSDKQKQNSA